MSFNLFKFQPPWSLQNQSLSFLDKKTSFSINFCPKTILETVINLSIISKKHQRNQKSIWVHVYFFINFKGKKKHII